jgi:pimeloyl-[acyl-carrier protein] methyl ester esterase
MVFMTARIWSETAGQGVDLVLIHGWGMNASVWDGVLPDLRQKFRVTVLDLPGHGRSSGLTFDGLAEISDRVQEVLPENAVLLGWSMGGLIALRLASHYPERYGQVLLVSSSPCFVRRSDWSIALDPGVFNAFGKGLEEDYPATLKRFLALQLKGADNARGLARSIGIGLEAHQPEKDALIRGLDLLNHVDLRDTLKLPGLRVSALLGGRDTLVPSGIGRALSDQFPMVDIETVEGAGHMPFITHGDAFRDWVSRKVNG